jgi:hypothetical protein
MRRTQRLALLLAFAAALSLTFGTAGFSAAQMDRNLSVNVVPDEKAYVGYHSADQTVQSGESVHLVTVTNRLTQSIEVTDVAIDSPTVEFSDVSKPTLEPGEQGAVEGTATCAAGTSETVAVTITVVGADLRATIFGDTATRTFELTCVDGSGSIDGVRFEGAGAVRFQTANLDRLNLTYWTTDTAIPSQGSAAESTRSGPYQATQVDVTKPWNPAPANHAVIAVYVPEFDRTYVHPAYDVSENTVGPWGARGNHSGLPHEGNIFES